LAIKGSEYADDTDVMNCPSEIIEERRLCVERVERRREESVLDRFGVLER
jgi:hypothetical protein